MREYAAEAAIFALEDKYTVGSMILLCLFLNHMVIGSYVSELSIFVQKYEYNIFVQKCDP